MTDVKIAYCVVQNARVRNPEYGTHTDHVPFQFFDVVTYRTWPVSALRVCLRVKITVNRDNAHTIMWPCRIVCCLPIYSMCRLEDACTELVRNLRIHEIANTCACDGWGRVYTPDGRRRLHQTAGKRMFTRVCEDHWGAGLKEENILSSPWKVEWKVKRRRKRSHQRSRPVNRFSLVGRPNRNGMTTPHFRLFPQ